MKLFKIIFLSLFLVFITNSCDKNENFSISEPVNSFKLNEPAISNVFLNYTLPQNPAFTINWSDDVTGASTYEIQLSLDYGFTNVINLGTVQNKQFTINVADFNEVLNNAGVTSYSNYPVYVRVKSGSVFSNIISLNVNVFPEENPTITAPATNSNVVLSINTPDDTAVTFDWTYDSFDANAVVHPTYTVEVAVAGGNFTNLRLLGETTDLTLDVTSETFNQAALTLGVEPETPTAMQVRVKASIESTSGVMVRYSDPITLNVTAYPEYPELYLVGSATAAGWDPNNHNHPLFKDPNQNGHYVYVGFFNAGMFKMLEVKGQWQPQWGKGATDGTLAGNPATQTGDPDVITVPTSGYYTFDVNLTNLTYTLTPYDASAAPTYNDIGLIGHATPTGWGSDTNLTQSSFNPHIWYAEGFPLIQDPGGDCDCGFKFRANDDWGINWGGNQNPPTLNYGVAIFGGKNIGVPETGNYTVFFNDIDGRYWYVLD